MVLPERQCYRRCDAEIRMTLDISVDGIITSTILKLLPNDLDNKSVSTFIDGRNNNTIGPTIGETTRAITQKLASTCGLIPSQHVKMMAYRFLALFSICCSWEDSEPEPEQAYGYSCMVAGPHIS